MSQQPNQQQQVQQVAQQLQQQSQHQEPPKMQTPRNAGPVPLLQQRMEANPQAPLQAPPSAAANPPDLPLPPKILNIKKEVQKIKTLVSDIFIFLTFTVDIM